MKKIFLHIIFLLMVITFPRVIFSQESIWDQYLQEEVEVENPVYKPVLGIGGGMMSFIGDIQSDGANMLIGQPSLKVNISTFLDKQHYSKLNFYLDIGSLSGENKALYDAPSQTIFNFKSNVYGVGINADYGFGHFFEGEKRVRPFIATGIQGVMYNYQHDTRKNGTEYEIWEDKTIRSKSADAPLKPGETISVLKKDDEFDESGNGTNYTIPVDIGMDYYLSDRATMRFGVSYNFAGADDLDGLELNNDMDQYVFSYATFHYDLWSEEETIIVDKLFAELDAEAFAELASDEDYDNVLDFGDECPGTPFGVQVDTLGCPLDDDNDGVPNYQDEEPGTAPGAFVDEKGQTIEEGTLIAMLNNEMAVNREEVYEFRDNLNWSRYSGDAGEIPDKFKQVDTDQDGYISFEELLNAIDSYFDFNSPYNTNDIYELNDFFFAQ